MEQEKIQHSHYQIISMMDLRKNIGAIINEVVYKKKTYLIERRGKPLCTLDAYSDVANEPIQPNSVSNVSVSNISAERLFGCIKSTADVPEEWTSELDQAEKDYQTRIDKIWDSKK